MAEAAGGPISVRELTRMDVSLLGGVGPRKLDGLRSLGVESLWDLLMHTPRRYVDRSREARVDQLAAGDDSLVVGTVGAVSSRRVRGGRAMVTADLVDRTGRLRLTFFNQPWREAQLRSIESAGESVAVFGRVEEFRGRSQMTNPVVDRLGDRTGRIVAIYPLTEKSRLSTWEISDWVAQTLRRSARRGILDPVPADVLDRHGLVTRAEALRAIHAPASPAELASARTRLVVDELLRLQLALVQSRVELERSSTGIAHPDGEDGAAPGLVAAFLASLPYELTGAQRRAIEEIRHDMCSPVPMHRLLQGDVGSGKTLVAAATLLRAVQGGSQGALMAPTEVLAEQHLASLRSLLDGLAVSDPSTLLGERPLSVALLSNGVRAAERRRVLSALADGSLDLVVGTHALISDGVEFRRLGAVVVDEQHRFGVEQRSALRGATRDGTVPDVLVMTATPIPRTAAMTVYGDLDVTVLDEMPPGRTPVETVRVSGPEGDEAAWEAVRAAVTDGQRAFVVCPLVEESASVQVASAEQVRERLAQGPLSDLSVGLLHGRMPGEDKQRAMDRFRSGRDPVLVATTVIEVGVDVPEATVMVVLDADRFGIAQLHQLRGRVGRGTRASRCILVASEDIGEDGAARLDALVASGDGFELAEVDLDLRGEGTVLGERQKGRSDLKLASLRRDREWVAVARSEALALVGDGDGLAALPELADEVAVLLDEPDREFLLKS